ncbi:MAG: carbon-nitrogen hydrolase family protein [Propionibacteriales bacterium]|nr:carbon-nitrogen hydrolase family protein [Propionibacteriales bacterium]
MRAFTAAALQVQPIAAPLTSASIEANVAHCVDWVRRCASESHAELIVLPETCTTGFSPGVGPHDLWDLVDEIPGSQTLPLHEAAAELGIHLVYGAYERGPERGVVYNSAVLVGPDAGTLAVYRKTHPFCTEIVTGGGWVTPGDDSCVVETELATVGLVICFDGDFPELSRICAIQGAEVLVRPSALLRSADIWELTNRARAYDNHVFVVGANATGIDPAGAIYFGNSMIVTPVAEVVARASSVEQWVVARLDPEQALASLTPGSSVPQGFDHLADRNLDLIKNHLDTLAQPAWTSFGYRRAGAPMPHRSDPGTPDARDA